MSRSSSPCAPEAEMLSESEESAIPGVECDIETNHSEYDNQMEVLSENVRSIQRIGLEEELLSLENGTHPILIAEFEDLQNHFQRLKESVELLSEQRIWNAQELCKIDIDSLTKEEQEEKLVLKRQLLIRAKEKREFLEKEVIEEEKNGVFPPMLKDDSDLHSLAEVVLRHHSTYENYLFEHIHPSAFAYSTPKDEIAKDFETIQNELTRLGLSQIEDENIDSDKRYPVQVVSGDGNLTIDNKKYSISDKVGVFSSKNETQPIFTGRIKAISLFRALIDSEVEQKSISFDQIREGNVIVKLL